MPALRLLVPGALLSALLLPVAGEPAPRAAAAATKPPSAAGDACAQLPGPAPEVAPRAFARNGLNLASEHLEGSSPRRVQVCALVDELGIVRASRIASGGTPFDSAAAAAVRWWLFEPARREGKAVAATLLVPVEITPPADGEPLVPDVLAMAVEAEARGDVRGALDAWTGVLARVGVHPTLGDEWSVRERILRLAARLPSWPDVPVLVGGRARGARNLMQRNIARGDNADYARTLDEVLRAVPWYVDAYRWRAAARAASGQRPGAIRDVLCYETSAPDSASRAIAGQALRALAVGDTLAANSLLKY